MNILYMYNIIIVSKAVIKGAVSHTKARVLLRFGWFGSFVLAAPHYQLCHISRTDRWSARFCERVCV